MSDTSAFDRVEASDVDFIKTIEGFKDLEEAAKGNAAITCIEKSQYAGIDITDVVKRLFMSEELVRLAYGAVAYGAVGNQRFCVDILRVMGKYETMLLQLSTPICVFVDSFERSLSVHRFMQKAMDKKRPAIVFSQCERLSTLALSMKKASEDMKEAVETFRQLAADALEHAQDDGYMNPEIQQFINETRARLALEGYLEESLHPMREERDKVLTIHIDRSGDDVCAVTLTDMNGNAVFQGNVPRDFGYGQLLRLIQTELKYKFALVTDSAVVLNLLMRNALVKDIPDLDNDSLACHFALNAVVAGLTSITAMPGGLTEEEARIRRNLAQQQAEDEAKLINDLKEIKTMRTDKTEIGQASLCLVSCIRAVGQVKPTIGQAIMFWDNVARHCENLAEHRGDASEAEFGEEAEREWAQSAAGWAALGLVHIKALRETEQAFRDRDDAMRAHGLRDISEVNVVELVDEMLADLASSDL